MTTCNIQPAREQVLLSQIIFDEGLYPRVEGHDPATVQTYARDMEQIEAAGKLSSISQPSKALSERRHREGIRPIFSTGLRLGKLRDVYITRRDLYDNQSALQ